MILKLRRNLDGKDLRIALKMLKQVEGSEYNPQARQWHLPEGWAAKEKFIGCVAHGGIPYCIQLGEMIVVEGWELDCDGVGFGIAPPAPVEAHSTQDEYQSELLRMSGVIRASFDDARATVDHHHERGDSDAGYREAAKHEARAADATARREALIAAHPTLDQPVTPAKADAKSGLVMFTGRITPKCDQFGLFQMDEPLRFSPAVFPDGDAVFTTEEEALAHWCEECEGNGLPMSPASGILGNIEPVPEMLKYVFTYMADNEACYSGVLFEANE